MPKESHKRSRILLIVSASFLIYFIILIITLTLLHRHLEKKQIKKNLQINYEIITKNHNHISLVANKNNIYLINPSGLIIRQNINYQPEFIKIDFNNLSNYTRGSRVNSGLENWFLMSKPIYQSQQLKAYITAGMLIYSDHTDQLENKLRDSIQQLNNYLTITSSEIKIADNYQALDINGILITDNFSNIIVHQGFIPYMINNSQLAIFWNKDTLKKIKIDQTSYLLASQLININHTKHLLLAVAKLDDSQTILHKIMPISGLGAIIFIIITIIILKIFQNNNTSKSNLINKFSFDTKTGDLITYQKTINIAFDSNQFYLIKALISQPNKWWDFDILVDQVFGTTDNPKKFQRSIYDAARLINEKTQNKFGVTLIKSNAKRYRINPDIWIESQ